MKIQKHAAKLNRVTLLRYSGRFSASPPAVTSRLCRRLAPRVWMGGGDDDGDGEMHGVSR